ncbi:MAG: hypothetical protein GWP62_06115 [Gammaproteobacteria bacterium]|nr:hypothetical protein [Gammaproteobacteria bacterium]
MNAGPARFLRIADSWYNFLPRHHRISSEGSPHSSSRTNPAADQTCANCALVPGNDGDTWRPCQIFPGKAVNADGWCAVWAAKG